MLWTPLLATACLLLVGGAFGLDQRVADAVYAWEGHRWALKRALATEWLIHRGGRMASLAAWLSAFAAWAWALGRDAGHAWRRPLAYLLLATLLSNALVAWIKAWSNMDCPWDLVRYGGSRPFVGLFQVRPSDLPRSLCFPAAHAASGYAWVALYFFLGQVRPRWRLGGLLVGLGAGLLFGISQQLRGAHFVSHDLVTFAICWAMAAGLHAWFWPGRQPGIGEGVALPAAAR